VKAAEVIKRLQRAVEARTDQDLADRIDVSKTTVASWRTRDSIPYDICVTVAVAWDVSLHWLILGLGPQHAPVPDLGAHDVDYDLLGIALGERREYLAALDKETQRGRRLIAKNAFADYLRYRALQDEAVGSGKLTKADFLAMLVKSRKLPSGD
jgi:hypothetical protein